MYSQMGDENFTKQPMYSSGKYGIRPLNDTGIENYLAFDSYNYRFLNKIDPAIIKEYMEEVKQGKKIAEEEKNKKQNVIEDNKSSPIQDIKNENCETKINEPVKQSACCNQNKCEQPKVNNQMKCKQVKHNAKPNQKQRTPFENKDIKFNNNQKKQSINDYYKMSQKQNQKQFPLIATVSGTRAVY